MFNFDQMMEELLAVKELFGQRFYSFITYIMLATGNIYLLSWVCMGIGVFVLMIVISSIIVFSYRIRDKCHFFSCPTNFCTFFLGFITFVFAIICAAFLIISYLVTGFCDYSYASVKTPEITTEVRQYFKDNLKGFFSEECYGDVGASISKYVQFKDPAIITNLDEISLFLDGLTNFDNFLPHMSADRFDNGIEDVLNEWDLFKQGIKENFYDVNESLQSLNLDIEKCEEYWVLNKESCVDSNNFTCKDILSNNSFDSTRTCVKSPEQSQEVFRKLRSSFESQSSLMSEMISKLGNISSNSAHFEVSITSISKCGLASTIFKMISSRSSMLSIRRSG
jgi:hypothetical protein